MFRTPSLRNVATRRVFFHNGVFRRLEDVVRFYAERDTRPEKWYPLEKNGVARKFDDLPFQYQGNVERLAPFDRHMGDQPAMSETDIKDIVAFLNTLTDGYEPRQAQRRGAVLWNRASNYSDRPEASNRREPNRDGSHRSSLFVAAIRSYTCTYCLSETRTWIRAAVVVNPVDRFCEV
jgi:hypothetical protein